ncbi:MAG: redoxin domain-containing protein [Cytophagales bacterium]|nr:redoxin domain-containing protein [Bernardetiaceae bacterium]MDW8205480.1 redoxin domain-containing protein [Cytophagales bacterium]
MRLSLNVSAPLFQLKDVFGRLIDLASYEGKRVLIAFFRHTGCPFCNMRVHVLKKYSQEFSESNLEMIFFFESKEKTILNSIFHQGLSPIPIISDPEKIWYGIYGLEDSMRKSIYSHLTSFIQTAIKAKLNNLPVYAMPDGESFSTMPAEFLLDEKLIIRELKYAAHLNDRLSVEEIRRFINRKNLNDSTTR